MSLEHPAVPRWGLCPQGSPRGAGTAGPPGSSEEDASFRAALPGPVASWPFNSSALGWCPSFCIPDTHPRGCP